MVTVENPTRIAPATLPERVGTQGVGGEAFAPFFDLLCCPACRGLLVRSEGELACTAVACDRRYPVIGGRAVLIVEERSVFSHAGYRDVQPLDRAQARSWWDELVSRASWPSVNLSSLDAFATLKAALVAKGRPTTVLVVGSGRCGKGMRVFADAPSIRFISIDPSTTSHAEIFCDGHDLPFADGTIDAVITQAVLEHVADPVRCVAEIHRVLAPDGLVYSEIPFMQEVHEKGYDFTRFSHLGHRRLYRAFDELDSGAVAGPGTTLAWAWRYFLASFSRNRTVSKVLFNIGRATALPIELTDYVFRQRPAALDAASCTYFLGRRATTTTSDRALIAAYRGAAR